MTTSSALEQRFALIVRARGWPPPQREYRFCTDRGWRFDFAWPERKIAVELEGGTWSGGRHVRGAGYQRDCEKYNWASLLGWIVLRFTREMLDSGAFLHVLDMLLQKETDEDEADSV